MKRKLLCTLIAGLGLALSGAAQAAISGGVVKIGVMNDMSGPYADLTGTGSVLAAKMAAEDYAKATGSKLKIEIISADHQNKPDVGSSIARKWYDTEGVDMITDVPTSSVALAVSQVTTEKNKVNVNTGGGSSDLTGKACSPNFVHWLYDTWMLAHGTGSAVVKAGGDSWFFLTADYAFGHALERDTSEVVKASGGKVLGGVKVPLGTSDFSSFLLQAQSSKAKVVGLANAGADFTNSVKQAAEFGIVKGGQKMAGLLVFITDVHGLGLQTAQGLQLTETFYWDHDDGTRAWSKRFAAANGGKYPSADHAGVYASVLHYLKAVDALQDDTDGKAIVAKMKAMPTDDILFGKGTIRADGRKLHPAYLFEVKKPSESKYPWDYYKLIQTIPADKAFRPLDEGGCPLVAKK
ncbi:MAG: ABC transporter substrate-binding protein [Burkholderiaceae bacterium]|nr:ABC transporter substrate-binding protein [Pseudomonadota bacterium]MBS0598595.1 ABC transporter substrate-binding protein [Pseudomonadota bacterium]MCO5117158.1 ABC transporter substrate-binding protein [Burkholderiaceae bacterium]MCP5217532.1 ABC transporter substrate-binding protein [Burkholderiaceae bacterium]